MSSGIKKLRAKFETIYSGLDGEYEGYIQMSDKRIEHVYVQAKELPTLEELYVDVKGKKTEVNYVLEMALYDAKTTNSILIRQHNDDFLVLKKELKDVDEKDIDSFYTVTSNTPKMKIAKIWEEEKSEFRPDDMKILVPKALMFAGFESKGGKS